MAQYISVTIEKPVFPWYFSRFLAFSRSEGSQRVCRLLLPLHEVLNKRMAKLKPLQNKRPYPTILVQILDNFFGRFNYLLVK